MTDIRTEKTSEAAQALEALSAAGDVAYVWEISSGEMRWHGDLDNLEFDFAAIKTAADLASCIHGDDLPLREQRLNAHLTRGVNFDCEYRLRLDDGDYAWFHDRGSADIGSPGPGGKPARVMGVLRLITGRKAAEQRLEHLANYDELTGHFNKQRLR